MPTQRYDVLSKNVERIFVGTLSVELNSIGARKWNPDKVIIFLSVILQCTQGVNNPENICARILFQLDWWNCGAFDELVEGTFIAAT